MYAHRQIFDHPQKTIPVPEQLQNQRIEVIFIQLDEVAVLENQPETEKETFVSLAQTLAHPASADIDLEVPTLNISLRSLDE